MEMRCNIIDAASHAQLDITSLKALKRKMEAVQRSFDTICIELLEKRPNLVYEAESWW